MFIQISSERVLDGFDDVEFFIPAPIDFTRLMIDYKDRFKEADALVFLHRRRAMLCWGDEGE
jgi:hypothetical protein